MSEPTTRHQAGAMPRLAVVEYSPEFVAMCGPLVGISGTRPFLPGCYVHLYDEKGNECFWGDPHPTKEAALRAWLDTRC